MNFDKKGKTDDKKMNNKIRTDRNRKIITQHWLG